VPGKGGVSLKGLGILILAGGGGKRFGGEKAFFEINGKPMIQHVVERVSDLSKELVIACRSDGKRLAKMFPTAKVIVDKSEIRGALAGLVGGLPEIESEYTAVMTCDCPLIEPEVIKMLFERARGRGGAVPRWPNGYLEPLQAVYNTTELLKAANRAWERNDMRLTKVLKLIPDLAFVSTDELRKVDPLLKTFLNVNSPEELRDFPDA
jgi:molybdopterin-guanine dinucleotide biosynthesis protein A